MFHFFSQFSYEKQFSEWLTFPPEAKAEENNSSGKNSWVLTVSGQAGNENSRSQKFFRIWSFFSSIAGQAEAFSFFRPWTRFISFEAYGRKKVLYSCNHHMLHGIFFV